MKQKEVLEKYKNQSVHYLGNAFGYIEAGDSAKASEFLWGSIAEALKAVAATKGISLNSHGGLRSYAMELTKEQKDDSIFRTFRDAESLHRNFYEFGFGLEDVHILAKEVREVVSKLLKLASQETSD